MREASVNIPDFLKDAVPANAGAFAAVLVMGLPTPKNENFKYSHLPRAVQKLPLTPVQYQPTMSGPVDDFTAYADPYTIVPRALPLLNASFASDVLYISVPDETRGVEPLTLNWACPDQGFINPSMAITIGNDAEFTLIEVIDGPVASWQNRLASIYLGDRAKLNYVRIVSGQGVITDDMRIDQGEGSHFSGYVLHAGADFSRHDIHASLNGNKARFDLRSATVLHGDQHADLTACIHHTAPDCASFQSVRTILNDRAHGVYQGKIKVDQSAQKTDGYQLSNALLLSPLAAMDTKPELEIYADDVKCTHGATTGALDDDQLFYLMSRGLNRAEAQKLLIGGFVAAQFDDAPDTIRDMIMTRLEEVLS